MPLPGDVSVFTLSGGPYTDATGAVVLSGVTGTLVPVDGNGRPTQVVHAADGSVIVPESVPITIGSGGTWTVVGLAHTDDPHLTPTGFLYQVTWKVPAYRSTLVNKLFAVPIAAGATVDFDLLASGTTTTGVTVNLPSVISVNGHTGAVTLAAADVGADSSGAAAAAQAFAVQRANHTGTQPATTLTGLDTAVAGVVTPGGSATAAAIAADPALKAALVSRWQPSTAYAQGFPVVNPSGQTVTANAAFTAGATYNAANWTAVSGGGGTGVLGKGYRIPKGSLAIWDAAVRNGASASQLVEAVFFGDSTTLGSTSAGAAYSIVVDLRIRALADGLTDGGRGVAGTGDTATLSGENLSIIQSRTGFGASGGTATDFLGVEGVASTTGNDVVIFQGKGTALRLHYSQNQTCGQFTYSIDGGPPTTINAYIKSGNTTYGAVYVSGLTEGTHTVTVTNLGGIPIVAPTMGATFDAGAGTLTAGTYYYVATNASTAGETTASGVASRATTGNKIGLQINGSQGTSVHIYRGTSSGGPFGLLDSTAPNPFGTLSYTDDGSKTPNMATNPPVSNTAGLDSSVTQVRVAAEFFRAAGVVLHKQAASGSTATQWFGNTAVNNNDQAALGLAQGNTGGNPGSTKWGQAKASSPTWRAPKLAVFSLGINDQAGTGGTDASAVTKAAALFIREARQAGADPLIIVPNLEWAGNADLSAPFYRSALVTIAEAYDCAWLDVQAALGLPTAGVTAGYGVAGNVHPIQAGYQALGAFIWNNVLGPNAPR